MSDDNQNSVTPWSSVQVYVLSTVCLLVGVTVGYLFRGSAASQAPAESVSVAATSPRCSGTNATRNERRNGHRGTTEADGR